MYTCAYENILHLNNKMHDLIHCFTGLVLLPSLSPLPPTYIYVHVEYTSTSFCLTTVLSIVVAVPYFKKLVSLMLMDV